MTFASVVDAIKVTAWDAAGTSVTSKSAARQAEGVAKRLAAMAPKIADAKDLTLAEVIADMQPRWKREATWTDKQRHARELVTYFGAATAMRAIDETQIRAYTDFALAQPLRVWTGGPAVKRTIPTRPSSGKTPAGPGHLLPSTGTFPYCARSSSAPARSVTR